MKKILFYINRIARGGTEIALYNLISKLDASKYRIFVTCTDKNSFGVLKEKIGKYCEYIDIDKKISIDTLVYCTNVSIEAIEKIKNVEYKKAYFWFHYYSENQEKFLKNVSENDKVDKIITVCDTIKKDLLKREYINENKIITIKNVLNINAIKTKAIEKVEFERAKDLNLIVISRLVKEKGFGRLNELLKYIREKELDYKVLIVGTANTQEEIKEIHDIFKDDARVLFLGYQENPYKYLIKCDYNVLLSDIENMSLSLMEAKVLGIPNIVTDFKSAFEEVKDGENGFILSMNNTETYKNRIDEIILKKEMLKENLKNFKYDEDKIIRQWEKIL